MQIEFRKASKKDKTLVTITLSQFKNTVTGTLIGLDNLRKGDVFLIYVDDRPTAFTINRTDKNGCVVTAASHTFPRYLRLPQVGKPVKVEVHA